MQEINNIIAIKRGGHNGIRNGMRNIAKDATVLSPMMNTSPMLVHKTPSSNMAAGSGRGDLEEGQVDERGATIVGFRDVTKKRPTSEWKEVAHVMDRLFFILVFTAMSTSAVTIFSMSIFRGGNELRLPVDSNEDLWWSRVHATIQL